MALSNPYPFTANIGLPAADLTAGIALAHYRRVTPTTGSTVAVLATPADLYLLIDPAGTLATLTLTMPSGTDQERHRIRTRQRIDALTINGTGGQTVDWAVNELPQHGGIELVYVSAITTWVRA